MGSPSRPTTAFLLGITPGGDAERSVLATPSMLSALAPILGRSPFQRHLRHLANLGVTRFVVPVESGQNGAALEKVCRQQAAEVINLAHELIFVLGKPGAEAEGSVALIETGHVIDPRIYRAAFSAERSVWVGDPGSSARSEPLVVGLRITSTDSGALVGPPEEMLSIGEIDPYIPNLRRTLRPYWTPTEDAIGRRRAADMLLDATQKGVLDFPARFLHPPPENFLVRVLAPTPITPNQITIFTGIIGFWATWLFAMEAYAPAIVIALVVNVLDGVDGKLARVKLLASRFGDKLDHILDILFEFSWYIGIGWGLSGGSATGTPLRMGMGLIGIMLGTRAMSGVYKRVSGRQIHDHRAFDRMFRLVAGRRNIYVFVMLFGLLLGHFGASFALCFLWGLTTLAVYCGRTALEATRL